MHKVLSLYFHSNSVCLFLFLFSATFQNFFLMFNRPTSSSSFDGGSCLKGKQNKSVTSGSILHIISKEHANEFRHSDLSKAWKVAVPQLLLPNVVFFFQDHRMYVEGSISVITKGKYIGIPPSYSLPSYKWSKIFISGLYPVRYKLWEIRQSIISI